MPTRLPGGGWELSDEEAAEVARQSGWEPEPDSPSGHVEQVTVNRRDLAEILARMPHDGEAWERLAQQMLGSSRALPDGTSLSSLPWRTGKRNDRTIYVMTGTEASDEDVFIGTLDTAELVAEAVAAHNYRLEMGRAVTHPVS